MTGCQAGLRSTAASAVVCVVLLTLPTLGAADVLGTANIVSGSTLAGPDHRVRPTFGYDLGNYAIQKILFDDVWIDSTSVGSVLVATASSDADFSAVAARLSDNAADWLCVGTCEEITCSERCGRENLVFALMTPDFGPSTIESVTLRIEALSFGMDPRAGQIVQYTFAISVEGEQGVPVRPASWGSLKASYR